MIKMKALKRLLLLMAIKWLLN